MRLAFSVLAVAAMSLAPGYRPVIGAPSVAPARIVAGQHVTLVYPVTRSDTGRPLLHAATSCEPSVDGLAVPHTDLLTRGKMRLSLMLPDEGRMLTVKVVVRANGRTATRVTRLQIVQVPKPELTIDDAAIEEGNDGTTTLSFPVHLSFASGRTVSITYATADGTALAGSDYDAASGTLVFAPGETTKTLDVGVHGDVEQEPDETFTARLDAPANATLARGVATGTIVGDEIVLLAPARDAVIPQNAPGTGCSASPRYGTGSIIEFRWRTNGRPDIASFNIYLIHPGATIPLVNAGLGREATSYLLRLCFGYVAGINLTGWTWTVTAYDGGGRLVASASSVFSFGECRLADGSYCQ